jgi:hypothetical protein
MALELVDHRRDETHGGLSNRRRRKEQSFSASAQERPESLASSWGGVQTVFSNRRIL